MLPSYHLTYKVYIIQGDQKVSVHQKNNPHTIDELKMAITEYIRNVDRRAMLNTVFENTVRRVNKCLETGGGLLNIICNSLCCNHQVNRDFLITLYNELSGPTKCGEFLD